MPVLCAGMWVLRRLESVDASFMRMHVGFKWLRVCCCEFCAQAWGFKRFGMYCCEFLRRHVVFQEVWHLLMRFGCERVWILSGLSTPSITLVNTLENTTASTLLNTLVNTLVNALANYSVNTFTNVPVKTLLNTFVQTL